MTLSLADFLNVSPKVLPMKEKLVHWTSSKSRISVTQKALLKTVRTQAAVWADTQNTPRGGPALTTWEQCSRWTERKQTMGAMTHRQEQALSPRPSDASECWSSEQGPLRPQELHSSHHHEQRQDQPSRGCELLGQVEPHTCWWAHRQCSHWRRAWQCLWMPSVHPPLFTAVALPGAYPREGKMPVHTDPQAWCSQQLRLWRPRSANKPASNHRCLD